MTEIESFNRRCPTNTLQTKSGGYEDSWRSGTLQALIKEAHMDGTYSAAAEGIISSENPQLSCIKFIYNCAWEVGQDRTKRILPLKSDTDYRT